MNRRMFFEGAGLAFGPGMAASNAALTRRGFYDVRDHGARGDRIVNDAAAFQAAIDACHAAGGGVVYVPPGHYLCGGLSMKSFVTLYLENGATVYASTRREDYPSINDYSQYGVGQLIHAQKAERFSIAGPGVLHGQGVQDLHRRPGSRKKESMPGFRTYVILLEDCRDVTLRDFTILYSDFWACRLDTCRRVVVDGLTILNNYWRTNSDGIDPDSCQDVRISNCHITAGDDCICLKTHSGIPCEDVVVTNCTLESVATAIKFGTNSDGDFRRVAISNCTVRNSTVGVGFYVKDGAAIEGVTMSNLVIETVRDPTQVDDYLYERIVPIFFDIEKRTERSRIGAIRDVILSNIQIHSDNGILIQGMRESLIENLTIQNVLFRVTRPFDYSIRRKPAGGTGNSKDDRITIYARQPSYCTVANVRNLVVDNLDLQVEPNVLDSAPRSALAVLNARGVMIRTVRRTPSDKGGPVIDLYSLQDAGISACVAPSGTQTFVRVHGTRETDLSLAGIDFERAKQPVEWVRD